MTIKDLQEGLKILVDAGATEWSIGSGDYLCAGGPGLTSGLSVEQAVRLGNLGWVWDTRFECWYANV